MSSAASSYSASGRGRRQHHAGAARQRRVRDGHPGDVERAGAGAGGAGPPRPPGARPGRRAGPGLHARRGAGGPRAYAAWSSSRSSPRWWRGCATGPSPRPRPSRRRPRRGRRRRRPRGDRGRAGRAASTWCCSTSTTAPAYLVHDANAALYGARCSLATRRRAGDPAVSRHLVGGPRPGPAPCPARGVRRTPRRRRTTSTCRAGRSSTGCTRRSGPARNGPHGAARSHRARATVGPDPALTVGGLQAQLHGAPLAVRVDRCRYPVEPPVRLLGQFQHLPLTRWEVPVVQKA